MKKSIRLFLAVLILLFLGWSVVWVLRHGTEDKKSNSSKDLLIPLANPIGVLSFLSDSNLEDTVKKSLEGTSGTYAVYIKNLKTGETYMQNEHKTFMSASLYKLWIMATAYKQMKDGKLSEDQILDYQIADLNKDFNIASESAELAEGEFKMPVSQAIYQMITISHNYAALSLSKRIGLLNVASFLKSNGFTESSIGSPPKTTAYDIGTFFEKLYNGKLVDSEYSSKMIDLLKQQQLNDRIPLYLPDDTEIAHKTGELDYVKHDAGIVFSPNGDYIFVVLSESTYPAGAAEREANLSKDVYDYFSS